MTNLTVFHQWNHLAFGFSCTARRGFWYTVNSFLLILLFHLVFVVWCLVWVSGKGQMTYFNAQINHKNRVQKRPPAWMCFQMRDLAVLHTFKHLIQHGVAEDLIFLKHTFPTIPAACECLPFASHTLYPLLCCWWDLPPSFYVSVIESQLGSEKLKSKRF